MPSSPPTPDPARLRRAIAARMARLVIPEHGEMDRRDAHVLMRSGIIRAADEEPGSGPEAARIAVGAAAQPAQEPAGPLIFYQDPSGAGSVVRLRDLVMDRSVDIRRVAADQLERLAGLPGVCAGTTADAVGADAPSIRSEDAETWGPAAVRLADTIDADWLLQVAAVRQSRLRRMQLSWNAYINSALRPTAAGTLACAPPVLCPQRHPVELKGRLDRWSGSEVRLGDVLSEYIEWCGHLPLGGPASLGGVLRARGCAQESWNQLWVWARSEGVLARWHACQASLALPALVPDSGRDDLAEEFWRLVLHQSPRRAEGEQPADWRLLHELAVHFVQHLDVRLSMVDGEAVTAVAWWMAAQLERVLRGSPTDVRAFADQVRETAAAVSGGVWELLAPAMRPSVLRLLTLDGPSPWSVALLATVDSEEQMEWLLAGPGPGSREDRLHVLAFLAMETKLLLPANDAVPYTFAPGVGRAVDAALAVEGDGEAAASLRAASQPVRWSDSELGGLLGDILSYEPQLRTWLCHMVRRQVQSGVLKGDALWEIVSGDQWRQNIWPQLDPESLVPLGYTLTDLAVMYRPEWAPQVPHLLAEVAERRAGEERGRELAFAILVRAACALHAGSAIRRVRKGPRGHQFRKAAAEISATLETMLPHAGGWASGHIRATLTDLMF